MKKGKSHKVIHKVCKGGTRTSLVLNPISDMLWQMKFTHTGVDNVSTFISSKNSDV